MNKHGKLLEHHQITAKFIRENENKQKKLFLMIAHSYITIVDYHLLLLLLITTKNEID